MLRPEQFAELEQDADFQLSAGRDYLHSRGAPGWIAHVVAGASAVRTLSLLNWLKWLFQWFLTLAVNAMSSVIDIVEGLRPEDAASMDRLSVTAVNAYLNTNFDPSEITLARANKGDANALRVLGKKIFEQLERDFAPGQHISAEQGRDAAHTFAGYAIDIAVENAIQATLVEMASVGQLESWAELGDLLSRNMGFERLQRRALGNLVETTIGIPYDWYLNEKYRPRRLTTTQYIRAYLRGSLSRSELHSRLAQEGIADADIERLIADVAADLGSSDVERLHRWGAISTEQAIERLTRLGISREDAALRLQAAELGRAESAVTALINALEAAVANGLMDPDEYANRLERLPLTEKEKFWLRAALAARIERPRKKLTLAQMEDAFKQGLIGLFDYEEYLVREGYGDRDIQVLEYLLLLEAEKLTRDKESTRAKKLQDELKKRTPEKDPLLGP